MVFEVILYFLMQKFLDSSKLKDTFLFILEKEIMYVLMKAVVR